MQLHITNCVHVHFCVKCKGKFCNYIFFFHYFLHQKNIENHLARFPTFIYSSSIAVPFRPIVPASVTNALTHLNTVLMHFNINNNSPLQCTFSGANMQTYYCQQVYKNRDISIYISTLVEVQFLNFGQ